LKTYSNGTPSLQIRIVTSATLSASNPKLTITAQLGYEAAHSSHSPRPITIYDSLIEWALHSSSFSISKIINGASQPIPRNTDNDLIGPPNFEAGPTKVRVTDNPKFVELRPGDALERTWSMYLDDDFELDVQKEVGSKLGLRFEGERVRWWAWGSKQELSNVEVLTEETGNQGGVGLEVPISAVAEFEVVD
jgi:hypothetical protein